jgi:hypothetical protein
MTQQYATVILAAAVALTATVPAYGRQDQRADASRLVALRLRPDTLALFINNVAGLRVRLVSGVVDEIASPRVFTLKNERSARYPHRPNEVAIVVDTGSTFVREGAPVVVTGIARTLLGAEMDSDRPLPSLTESERKVVAKLPLVMASSVQTPDGVQLVRPNP